jgi:hypothetical protein
MITWVSERSGIASSLIFLMEYNPHNTAIPIKMKTMNLLWAHHSISLLIMNSSQNKGEEMR